jgi:hypothetical protein
LEHCQELVRDVQIGMIGLQTLERVVQMVERRRDRERLDMSSTLDIAFEGPYFLVA